MSLANDAQTNLVLSQMSGLQRKQLDRDGDGKFSASELAAGGFRGFNMSKTGPARDHASGDANTMKYLAAEAQKKQAYRSDEQKLTDHHQATGFTSAGPVAFGQYEVGRSSMPAHCHATRIFLDQTKRGEVYPHPDGHQKLEQGDPGHYTPYDIEGENAIEMKDVTRFTHNKQAKFAFGSLSERDIGQVRGLVPGIDAPGPGQYDAGRGKNYVYRTINPVNSAFNSKSLQRAESRTTVPGPGAYDAKFESIEAYQRVSCTRTHARTHPRHRSEGACLSSQLCPHTAIASRKRDLLAFRIRRDLAWICLPSWMPLLTPPCVRPLAPEHARPSPLFHASTPFPPSLAGWRRVDALTSAPRRGSRDVGAPFADRRPHQLYTQGGGAWPLRGEAVLPQ